MDASIRSVMSTVSAIRGRITRRREVTPMMIAELLFQETETLREHKLLRSFCTTGHWGLRTGGRTVHSDEVTLPEGWSMRDIASTHLRYGHVYNEKHGDRAIQYGILALACTENDEPAWLWITLWQPFEPSTEQFAITRLDKSSLADQLYIWTREEGKLHAKTVYNEFVHALNNHTDRLQKMANRSMKHYVLAAQSLQNLRVMIGE